MSPPQITCLVDLCRTCMGEGSHKYSIHKTVSIFNKPECIESKNITIMELLMLTTPQITIESGDMLPKILCENCLERLTNAYEFQQMCIRIRNEFLQIIKNQKPISPQIPTDAFNDSEDAEALIASSHVLKVLVDEPLIDYNAYVDDDENIINENVDIQSETENNQWDVDSNDFKDDGDSDKKTVLESPCTVGKGKTSPRTEFEKGGEEYVMSSGDVDKLEEQSSETSNKSKNILKDSKSLDDVGKNKNFICNECGKHLKTRVTLRIHKRKHQTGFKRIFQSKPYICEFCKKVFQQSSHLIGHLRTHTGERPYLCSECGKAFKSSSSMKEHFLRHGTDKTYACPDCPKKFPCISDLSRHKSLHNKIKKHFCDICGAGFVKPYLLKNHKVYHTGERNYKCDYCDMRCFTPEQRRQHMRIHTGEKPYKCKYCESAFARSKYLIAHLREHLGNNVYKCNLCPQRFRLHGDLQVHFNNHKNDNDETKVRNLQALKEEEQKEMKKFGLKECA